MMTDKTPYLLRGQFFWSFSEGGTKMKIGFPDLAAFIHLVKNKSIALKSRSRNKLTNFAR